MDTNDGNIKKESLISSLAMSLRDIVRHQIHRQATLQPRMALPAGRSVSLEEGYRLAKLFHEEEARVEQEEENYVKQGNTAVSLDEEVSRKIVLFRQQYHKEANIKANIAYGHRQKQRFSHAVSHSDTEKVLELAKTLHRTSSSGASEAHERRQRAAHKHAKKKSRAARKK